MLAALFKATFFASRILDQRVSKVLAPEVDALQYMTNISNEVLALTVQAHFQSEVFPSFPLQAVLILRKPT